MHSTKVLTYKEIRVIVFDSIFLYLYKDNSFENVQKLQVFFILQLGPRVGGNIMVKVERKFQFNYDIVNILTDLKGTISISD